MSAPSQPERNSPPPAVECSVVVPIKGGDSDHLNLLASIEEAEKPVPLEVILVYDGWWGPEPKAGPSFPIQRLSSKTPAGAAHCRNLGAEKALGRWLCFCDADTTWHPDTLSKAWSFIESQKLDGLVGSYDRKPGDPGIISQFRNLLHAFHHHQQAGALGVFWGAFGLVNRQAFFKVNGFDAHTFQGATVEDIDLGYRLHRAGFRLELRPEVLIKHHKRWTLGNMIQTDLFRRAIPWTHLLEQHKMWKENRLNVNPLEKVTALLAGCQVLCLLLAFWLPWSLLIWVGLFSIYVILQQRFYAFISPNFEKFQLPGILGLHLIYYLVAAIGFGLGKLKMGKVNSNLVMR